MVGFDRGVKSIVLALIVLLSVQLSTHQYQLDQLSHTWYL